MNKVTNGETTVADKMPMGLKDPNSFMDTGAVKVWAAVAEESEDAAAFGKSFE